MNFSKNAKVLLIGEGNFSFALNLCKSNFCKPEQLFATCYERENCLTLMAKENSELLKSKGASVFYSIDGRKLETYFDTSFSCIVFNFPHSGGKMKIQNNRQLLKEFFQSALKVLSQDGVVYVSLCSGQGGIPLDTTIRRWDDTWQVVPMATYGDFILTSVSLFDPRMFASYVCAGYRSLEKGFHQDGSILFKFSKSEFTPYVPKALEYALFHFQDKLDLVNVPLYIHSLLQRNIFTEHGSFVNFTFNYVVDILRTSFITSIQDSPVRIYQNEIASKSILRNKLPSKNELIVYPIIVLNTATSKLIPYCAIVGCEYSKILLHAFLNVNFSLNVLNSSKSWTPYWKTFTFSSLSFNEKIVLEDQENILIYFMNIQKLAHLLFDLENQELWRKKQNIYIDENGIIMYEPCSLFPPVYTFHLSFWIPIDAKRDLQSFHFKVNTVIVNIIQDVLANFSLLGSYNSVEGRISETYEITYCSLDKALSKIKVKELHEEVGRSLQLYLGCEIR